MDSSEKRNQDLEPTMPGEETFVERLGDIPILNDGWTSAVGCYSKIKDLNSVTKYTLEIAENGVKKAAEISSPVMEQYKSQINSVNAYACTKLDQIETRYPLIKQPSGEVKDACLEYVQPVVDRVKPVVSSVQNVVTTGKQKVDNIKNTSTKLVTDARDFGVGTVTGAVNMTLATPPGRLLTRTVDGALNIADNLVEKYIPEQEQEDDDNDADDNNDTMEDADNGEVVDVPQMEMMEPTPERVVVHFRSVSNKLRKRMFNKAMKDYQGAKTRTFEALGKLNNHVNLIDYAKTHLGNAKDKVENVWAQIVEEEKEVEAENEEKTEATQAGKLEERIISLGRILLQQVRSGVQTIEQISQSAGQFVRDPVSKSKEYKDLVVQFSSTHSLSDLSKASLDTIKSNIQGVRQNLQRMIDGLDPAWLVGAKALDVPIDNFGLDDEDEAINRSLQAPEVIGNHVTN